MTLAYNTHRAICFIINLLIVGLIIYTVKSDNSDKSIIIFMVFYPALFILNLIVSLVLWLFKSAHAKIYKQALIGLIILLIPSLILTTN